MKQNTKERILQKGAEIVKLKGFHHTGIQEILTAAGIPKGSFYFYFKNKEEFGLELIEYYSRDFISTAEKYYHNDNGPFCERLQNFFSHYVDYYKSSNFTGGCPVGNLAQEMGDINIRFRVKLNEKMQLMKSKIEMYINMALQKKEITTDLNAAHLADFIFNSWQGAILRTKITKNPEPLTTFNEMVFSGLFQVTENTNV